MATETMQTPGTDPRLKDDPFFYGWRMVPTTGPDGKETWKQVALTEWDLLHPQEGDFVVTNLAHVNDCNYLRSVFRKLCRGRTDMLVMQDHRIDWQIDKHSILGPDLLVLENLNGPWDPNRGTFPVEDMGARALFIIEVISPSTEKVDKKDKLSVYERVGVPLYIIAERQDKEGETVVSVYGYRLSGKKYVRIADDPRGIWIEPLRVWVRSGGERVVVADEGGTPLPDYPELSEENEKLQQENVQEKQRAERAVHQAEQERLRAEQERQRAELENQRAEQERQRAELEKQRADLERQRADALEAELRRLRGEKT